MGLSRKDGQWRPVAANTSRLGRLRDFMSKTVHERGNAGSQVTRKLAHRRQSGALSGFVGIRGILSAIAGYGKSGARR